MCVNVFCKIELKNLLLHSRQNESSFCLVILPPILEAPSNIQAKSFSVSWTEPETGNNARKIDKYYVEWISIGAVSGGSLFVPTESTEKITAVINDSLISNTEYKITVAAAMEDGTVIGEKSNEETVTTCK